MPPNAIPQPIRSLGERRHHTLYGLPCHEDETLDGARVRVGGVYYCRARLHPPRVRVRITGQRCTTRSWIDGRLVLLWEAEPEDASDHHRIVVEPWMLSVAPVDEAIRRLAARAAALTSTGARQCPPKDSNLQPAD